MARRVFFSFHHTRDSRRASQVRNIGSVEGNTPVTDHEWEQITRRGDAAIMKWIHDQTADRVCTVVLIGQRTAGRKWINYEIRQSWKLGHGLLGIYIQNLTNGDDHQSPKGSNPFQEFTIGSTSLSEIVKVYDPPHLTGTSVHEDIKENIAEWVEQAIDIRNRY